MTMSLVVSPPTLRAQPMSTSSFLITNTAAIGHCFQLSSKFKHELRYRPSRGFIPAGAAQWIEVSTAQHLTPGLRIQIVAVAVEQSLGVPNDGTIRAIIDGAKRLRTPCISLKIPVINTEALSSEEEGQTFLVSSQTQKNKTRQTSDHIINDSELSLMEAFGAQAQKDLCSMTQHTETFYNSDHTCLSFNDSQIGELPPKRSINNSTQYSDRLSNDMVQLKLQMQQLENKINLILGSMPTTPVHNLQLSEIELSTLATAVTDRLSVELKNKLASSNMPNPGEQEGMKFTANDEESPSKEQPSEFITTNAPQTASTSKQSNALLSQMLMLVIVFSLAVIYKFIKRAFKAKGGN